MKLHIVILSRSTDHSLPKDASPNTYNLEQFHQQKGILYSLSFQAFLQNKNMSAKKRREKTYNIFFAI